MDLLVATSYLRTILTGFHKLLRSVRLMNLSHPLGCCLCIECCIGGCVVHILCLCSSVAGRDSIGEKTSRSGWNQCGWSSNRCHRGINDLTSIMITLATSLSSYSIGIFQICLRKVRIPSVTALCYSSLAGDCGVVCVVVCYGKVNEVYIFINPCSCFTYHKYYLYVNLKNNLNLTQQFQLFHMGRRFRQNVFFRRLTRKTRFSLSFWG